MINRLLKVLALILPLFLAGCLPSQELSAKLPVQVLPVALPVQELPVTLPAQELPATLPAQELPATLPAQELPATLPAQELPVALPVQELPVALPVQELPATLPAQELPVTPPPRQFPVAMPAQQSSKTYRTQYTTISYSEEKDLHTFTRNIGSGLSFLWESPEKNPLLAKTQVDKMMEKVCFLLDMHPPNLRIGITLYRKQADVTAAYNRITVGINTYQTQGMKGPAPIAFYSHGARNIAVAIDSITDNILAHEIAHAVISAYFVTPPPARMQEILAQYMDKHFRDK